MGIAAPAAVLFLSSAAPAPHVADDVLMAEAPPSDFAEFGLFLDAAMTRPAPRVTPYELNSALFSDYADKARFLYVPVGKTIDYREEGVLGIPVGSALVKHFGFTRADGSMDMIETRILIHQADGWKAYPYVWDAEDRTATLKKAGARLDVVGQDDRGVKLALGWKVPNVNQCKGCHAVDGELTPIGPKARNLSGETGTRNDLEHLAALGLLSGLPGDPPHMPDWQDGHVPTDARARAYLDVNCAHCHNPAGPASNSGLFLSWETPSGPAIGIGKGPVAAGRGSGGRLVGIEPGDPDGSILLYRMDSTEPGVMMPELARTQRHDEAVDLMRAWIEEMTP
ncbi:hypothetical protein B5C34_04035 [Pacificimonas flava]|uniref:Cytochrome c domain-containing protein n=3 Tax=Sphingosinicellaceae TaxID=2820280 RepID=A0A219B4G4_9SPHN|nr:hypothetical protein [Pacificimonas aurantium]OWV32699.1 hypothetical protein B5C34_04035 [Pacificimonas flava]